MLAKWTLLPTGPPAGPYQCIYDRIVKIRHLPCGIATNTEMGQTDTISVLMASTCLLKTGGVLSLDQKVTHNNLSRVQIPTEPDLPALGLGSAPGGTTTTQPLLGLDVHQ